MPPRSRVRSAFAVATRIRSARRNVEVQANTQAEGAQAFAGMLAEIRAFGEGILIAEQSPSKLVRDAIANTSLKIAHCLQDQHEREAIAAAMTMDVEQQLYLGRLPRGQAAVFSGEYEKATFMTVRPYEDEPSPQTVKQYLRDFRVAVGTSDPRRFSKAADLLLEAKKKRLVLTPREMESVGTREKVEAYLWERAELHVPDDHVRAVKKALYGDITRFPESYGLTRREAELGKAALWVERVKPLGATTREIRDVLDRYIASRRPG